MRRLWAAGAAMSVCLALGAPVMAQEASPAADGPVRVTATQVCTWAAPGGVLTATCTNTASDPRVTGPGTLTMAEHVGVPGGGDHDDYLQTLDATLSGPEGTWTGRTWIVFDWPAIEAPAGVAGIDASLAHITTVLSGDGAYEGWTYVTTGTTSTSGPGPDLAGVLYEGPTPPGITTG